MSVSERVEKVQEIVDEALSDYGLYFTKIKDGHYRAVQGSAEVFVDVSESAESDVMIMIRAPVSYDAKMSEQELLFLLQANDNMPVGTFSVDESHTVYVGQTLFGEYLNRIELQKTVRAVAIAADCLEEIISERLQGKRSIDVKPWLRRLP